MLRPVAVDDPSLCFAKGEPSELRCMDCGNKFEAEVHFVRLGGGVAPVALLRLPTYDGEAIEVHPGLLFVLDVLGRLDLFAFDALEKAWHSVPVPRHLLVDFQHATEVSPRALKRLCDLRAGDREGSQASLIVADSQKTLRPFFQGVEHVYPRREAAALAQGGFSGRSFGAFCSSVQPEGSGEAAAARGTTPRHVAFRGRLEVEVIGDVLVVNFLDRKVLDEKNIQVMGKQLFSLVDEAECTKVLLNFGNVEYLSSAALGKFITMNKKLAKRLGRLVLCGIDPQIFEVFEITRLERFFKICKEEQAALQCF
jgi:anti-sigma B factor antagonist